MAKFYKVIDGDYIMAVGTGNGEIEITEDDYNNIIAVIQSRPTPADGHGIKLCADLTWEEYELPPAEEVEVTAEEVVAELEAIL